MCKKIQMPLASIALISAMVTPDFTFGQTPVVEQPPVVENFVAENNLLKDVTQEIKMTSDQKKLVEKIKHNNTWLDNLIDGAKNLNVQANLAADVNVTEFLNIGVNSRLKIEPAYVGGYFRRFDSFGPNAKVSIGKAFLKDSSPLLLDFEMGAEIGVWRLFKSKIEALRLKDMPPLVDWVVDYLPVTADKILKKMQPGDMVRFRVPLKILGGLDYTANLPGPFSASVKGVKVRGGNYDVFVFKSDGNKIRLRIIPRSDDGKEIKIRAGIDKKAVSTLSNFAVSITRTANALEYIVQTGDSGLWVADYTLDLSYPEVRKAYDDLFNKALVFNDFRLNDILLKLINPFKTHKDIRDSLILNLTDLETIFKEEVSKQNHELRRVDRNFLGSNDSDGSRTQSNIGISGLFRYSMDTSRRENRLKQITIDPEGNNIEKHFVFPTWHNSKSVVALASTFSEELFRSSNMIYEADKDYVPTKFSSIGFYYEYRDKKYKDYEHDNIIKHFKNILPEVAYEKFNQFLVDNNILELGDILRAPKIQSRYFLNANALVQIEKRFKNKNDKTVSEEILSLVMHTIESTGVNASYFIHGKGPRQQGVQLTETQVAKQIADLLKIIITPTANYTNTAAMPADAALALKNATKDQIIARKEAMNKLTRIPIFKKIGPAFLFSLLPDDAIESSLYFEFKFYMPNSVTPLPFIFPVDDNGKSKIPVDRELLEQILDLQNVLNDETPDLRREGDEDTLTERRTVK